VFTIGHVGGRAEAELYPRAFSECEFLAVVCLFAVDGLGGTRKSQRRGWESLLLLANVDLRLGQGNPFAFDSRFIGIRREKATGE
jgi:hypothetical protein